MVRPGRNAFRERKNRKQRRTARAYRRAPVCRATSKRRAPRRPRLRAEGGPAADVITLRARGEVGVRRAVLARFRRRGAAASRRLPTKMWKSGSSRPVSDRRSSAAQRISSTRSCSGWPGWKPVMTPKSSGLSSPPPYGMSATVENACRASGSTSSLRTASVGSSAMSFFTSMRERFQRQVLVTGSQRRLSGKRRK